MMNFIDETSPYRGTANDCRLKIESTRRFEETSRISEESRNNHWTLARLLGWLALKFPKFPRKQNNLRQTLNEYFVSIYGQRSLEPRYFYSLFLLFFIFIIFIHN